MQLCTKRTLSLSQAGFLTISYIPFSAKNVMREIMLADTVQRLPEVLNSLRQELASCHTEKKTLSAQERFNNPAELKSIVMQIMWHVQRRILSYLDGDLESAMKFPGKLQTLEEEIDEEDESEWSLKELVSVHQLC